MGRRLRAKKLLRADTAMPSVLLPVSCHRTPLLDFASE